MFVQFYENIILRNPKSIFVILIITLLSFGYNAKEFRLDASSETLLIEGDPDLKYLQEVSKRCLQTKSVGENLVTMGF